MRKHVSLLYKRPVPVPQYSLIPKLEWRLFSRSLKRNKIFLTSSINEVGSGYYTHQFNNFTRIIFLTAYIDKYCLEPQRVMVTCIHLFYNLSLSFKKDFNAK